MDRWQTTDPESGQRVWKIIEVGKPGNHALRVYRHEQISAAAPQPA